MRNPVNGLFHKLFGKSYAHHHQIPWEPAADIYRTEQGWLVKFELAGILPDEMEVAVTGQELKVRGIRRDYQAEEARQIYAMEIPYNRFERIIALPVAVSESEVRWEYSRGMLIVRIERGSGQ